MAEHIPEQDHGIYRTPATTRYDTEKDHDELVAALQDHEERTAETDRQVRSGKWLAELEFAAEAAFRDSNLSDRQRRAAKDALSRLGELKTALEGTEVTEGIYEAIHHAFEAGRAVEQVYVIPFEPATKAGKKHKASQSQKAKKRHAISNKLKEKVRGRYQRLIDKGYDPSEATKLILDELTEDWPKLKELPGARARPPHIKTIQRYVEDIKRSLK